MYREYIHILFESPRLMVVYSGQFMLTEVGHGLNARNLETTATMLPNGGFELHTPHERAAK